MNISGYLRSAVLTLAATAAIASASGGAVAYLSDTASQVNVMTLGSVKIKQIEQEWNEDKTQLQAFTQHKPLLPAVGEPDWENEQTQDGAYRRLAMENVVDKYVSVENTGKSDAYVRTVFAFEMGGYSDIDDYADEVIGMTRNSADDYAFHFPDAWLWSDAFTARIGMNRYMVCEAVHQSALAPGETTIPSLLQLYANASCDNAELGKLDGNKNGQLDVLALSQAVQADGFEEAQTALDTAFGPIEDHIVKWLDELTDDAVSGDGWQKEAYQYTPYVITPLHRMVYGDDVVNTACDLLDAFIAYETTCPCPNEDIAAAAFTLAVRLFPPFDAFSRRNPMTSYEDGTITFSNVLTRDEHEEMLVTFQSKIEEYMSLLQPNDSPTARALTLYRAITQGSSYDHTNYGEVEETPFELTPYYFLMNKRGICIGFSFSYAYLLNQAGIDATTASGSDRAVIGGAPGVPHEWTLMKLNGDYYFSDPTWENAGDHLIYFAFDQDWRDSADGGDFPMDRIRVAGYRYLDVLTEESGLRVDGNAFDSFRTQTGDPIVLDWRFNADRTGILYTDPYDRARQFLFP